MKFYFKKLDKMIHGIFLKKEEGVIKEFERDGKKKIQLTIH